MTQMNHREAEDLMKFAIDLRVHSFNAFNFIPTGRGKLIADDDLTPDDREALLNLLYRYMQAEQMTVMCTAPQFARTCIERRASDSDRMAIGHGGSPEPRTSLSTLVTWADAARDAAIAPSSRTAKSRPVSLCRWW